MNVEEVQAGDVAIDFGGISVIFSQVNDSHRNNGVICPECHLVLHKRSARRHYERNHLDTTPSIDDAAPIDSNSSTQCAASEREVSSRYGPNKRRKHDTCGAFAGPGVVDQDGRDAWQEEACRESEAEHQDDSDGNDIQLIQTTTPTAESLAEIYGSLPNDLVKSFFATMGLNAYQVSSKKGKKRAAFSVIASDRSAPRLALVLRPGYSFKKVDLSRTHHAPPMDKDLLEYDDISTGDHLQTIEQGGLAGLERLVGCVIVTDGSWLEVHCVEIYSRNFLDDPHAEPPATNPSSAPSLKSSTQYTGRLKVIVLYDAFGNPRLDIGVAGFNYLVVAGNYSNNIVVGPSRCGRFPVSERTRIFIRKARQDPNALDSCALGLAQVRSKFGHPTTYKTRRAGLQGFSALPQMPVTVFTLYLWRVEQALIFYRLWLRAREAEPGQGPTLHLEDFNSEVENSTTQGQLLRSLRQLVEKEGTLYVSASAEADSILSRLAASFSNMISDKNKVVMKNNASPD